MRNTPEKPAEACQHWQRWAPTVKRQVEWTAAEVCRHCQRPRGEHPNESEPTP